MLSIPLEVQAQIIDLLGEDPPEEQMDGRAKTATNLVYQLGHGRGFFGSLSYKALVIELDGDGIVTQYMIKTYGA